MLPEIYELRRICYFLNLTSWMYAYLQTQCIEYIKQVQLFVCQSDLHKVVFQKACRELQMEESIACLSQNEWVGGNVI